MSQVPFINCTTSTGPHNATCKICLETISAPFSCTTHTPCTNTFCTPCLSTWVRTRLSSGQPPTCPTCRVPLVAAPPPPPSFADPILTESLAFENTWRLIAANATCLPALNALISLVGSSTMNANAQPSPIPRVSDSTLTRLFTLGLMDPRSRPIQLQTVATYGVREWGLFSFPARNREEPRIGEAERRWFFVPMMPGREGNGGFVEWGLVNTKETRFGKWVGKLFGKGER